MSIDNSACKLSILFNKIIDTKYLNELHDQLINIYYENKVSENIRYKIYAYVAVGGLLWSNWCEYKQSLGLDFGEYSLAQYRYAKEYSKLVLNYLEKKNDKNK